MAVNGVSGTGRSLEDVTMPVTQRTTSRDLNQQDFMKIMIEQLKGQNPLDSGQDPNQFFTQMLQFQTMDAMTSMKKALDQLAQVSDLANASAMIGKTVVASVSHPADPKTGIPKPDTTTSGVVESVTFGSAGAMLNLDNNLTVSASKVTVVK